MTEVLLESLQGPYGGIVALSFGMGATGGYAFAMKTMLAVARERIAEMKSEIATLKDENKELRDQIVALAEK